MNPKLFVDTDVTLDLLAKREPFYRHAAELFSLFESGKCEGYVSALTIANLVYLIKREKGREAAISSIHKLKLLIGILPVDSRAIDLALSSDFRDFEDAIQYYSALENGMDMVITRNVGDYKTARIPVQSPEEYLNTIRVHRK